ncbi:MULTISPECIES: DUF6913 domain-containing protein [Gaetbulibacter]|jgi:hypothetical protein|uniref:Uncharacterized protein n=1 Tax=Gaetbulibacter jejuensis TaxID=584607 RepID=A0ABN1JUF0_9FLAO|nr:hypothetical protein [Gaetbulibacter sp. NE]RYH74806.1 hypothetical protein EVU94_07260 [Flavobacteriaceae bacterium 144Ye]
MILKAFREKSNQKYINKLLNSRNVSFSNTKVDKVGVILHLSEFSDFEAFRTFFESIDIKRNKVKIVAYVEDNKDSNDLWDTYFNPKDFGWNGKIKNVELQTFIDTEFDILISFYKQDVLDLNLISVASKAKFKVGLAGIDDRFYDLIINVAPKEFTLFKNELKKYLTVLNKI